VNRLRALEFLYHRNTRLIAVESVALRSGRSGRNCILQGRIKPVAVIVCGPQGAYALDMDARPADLSKLRATVPGLEALLNDCQ
jgi:hypothetical protein